MNKNRVESLQKAGSNHRSWHYGVNMFLKSGCRQSFSMDNNVKQYVSVRNFLVG